jgi:hypothetical protein
VLRHAIHLSLQLVSGDWLLPVIFERLRLEQIIFDLLFELRLRDHRVQRWLGIRVLPAAAGPEPVTPVNVLDRSLIGYALYKRQRSFRNLRWRFGAEDSKQCAAQDRTGGGYANKEGE